MHILGDLASICAHVDSIWPVLPADRLTEMWNYNHGLTEGLVTLDLNHGLSGSLVTRDLN